MRSSRLAALAALSIIVGTTSAVAQSPAAQRNAAPAARIALQTDDSSELNCRGIGIYLIGAVVLGLIVWGVIELTRNDDEAFPVSP